eukprot:CAMPEP_0176119602 /NCGR_PEP_ID=MMETSP0120_2-20121206/60139_1 /TAXON_ID=160619 /ORGANISM="Kryptoperidinium foliaceum, Strain CCMP 1326" /LENGTH=192 /DNA_ID=CAMNT_0017454011 /DNA_START=1 /DNA_END=579 /DNA_ORIENTATION=+
MSTGTGRRLVARCAKTRLCKFYQVDGCTWGANCSFAHDASELVEAPDLRRSKMCPKLRSGGRCSDDSCSFAHHRGELRKVVLTAGRGRRARRQQRADECATETSSEASFAKLDAPPGIEEAAIRDPMWLQVLPSVATLCELSSETVANHNYESIATGEPCYVSLDTPRASVDMGVGYECATYTWKLPMPVSF